MNATKRKFNALLQGLSSPRPASHDHSSDDMNVASRFHADVASHDAILQKRRRLGFPESTAPTLFSSSSTTTSLSNVVLRRSATQPKSKPASSAPTKYCPGDRNELLRRLATFQEITDWTPKPDKVNEFEWAKRGWVCQGKEKVRCVLCHKELLVKLSRRDSDGEQKSEPALPGVAEALVDKYSDLIISSHQQDCLWRKRGCGDTLLRLSFSNASSTLAALRQRYDELCSRSPFLPYEFNLRVPELINLDEVVAQLPSDFFTRPSSVPDKIDTVATTDQGPNRAALLLALMGWQGLTNSRIGPVPNSASCHSCLRRLGLWMFKSKEVDEQGQIVIPAPMDHLDPLREHRFFCPWKNALTQRRSNETADMGSNLPGWKTLLQMIKNESDLLKLYAGKLNGSGEVRFDGATSPTSGSNGTGKPGSAIPFTPNGRRNAGPLVPSTPGRDTKGSDDEKAREAKDKERWARLRKVKSLFDAKGSRRSRRESMRPGTGNSNKSLTGA